MATFKSKKKTSNKPTSVNEPCQEWEHLKVQTRISNEPCQGWEHLKVQTNPRNGVAEVSWSTHRIAAQEVRGSNLGSAETFLSFFCLAKNRRKLMWKIDRA